jgi:hypothetical protein
MSLWNWDPNGPIVQPPNDTRGNMKQRWNDIGRGKPNDSEKNLSQSHFVTAYPTKTDLGANTDLHGEKPVTNRLRDMARPK